MPRVRRPAALSAALLAASLGAPSACSQEAEAWPDDAPAATKALPLQEAGPVESDGDVKPPFAKPAAGETGLLIGTDSEVPGAESTEPVLRCVYRPHPSRVRAIYEFLFAHAAPGVDVQIRPREGTAASIRQVTRMAKEQVVSPDGTLNVRLRPVTETVAVEGGGTAGQDLELIVVAPPETQRAIGAFLELCVSKEPTNPATAPATVPRPGDSPFEDAANYDGGFSETPKFGGNPGGGPFFDGEQPGPDAERPEPGALAPVPDGFADPLPADFESPGDTIPAGPPRG
ncbi:hypothetical protein [Alienimonas sp. DA493]|uniref:hypothetical protein n=1 Tax=Alienimonas sp. DA493 TaxID=3373605 RepID=UPI0037541B03